jgi:hypothetical protein
MTAAQGQSLPQSTTKIPSVSLRGKGDAETDAHRETNKDDHLVLPRIVGSGLRRISCCSVAGVVCLAPGVLASSAGKFCNVFVV